MLDIKDSIETIWRKNGRGRFRLYVFKCLTCTKTIASRKCYFNKHKGICGSCNARKTIRFAIDKIRKRPFEGRYNNFVSRCPETNVIYEEYLEFTKIKNCHYCETLIPWKEYDSNTYGFFLDRKNNNIGHLKFNLVVCCQICNFTKRNEFSYEEFLIIGKAVNEVRKMRNNNL